MSMSVRPALRTAKTLLHAARYYAAPVVGGRSRYAIAAGYRHRATPAYFDDTGNSDEWQREVYETAREIMRRRRLKSVCDVGCGSGYKLVHILGEFDTVGIDVPETIEHVRKRYPERRWVTGDFDHLQSEPADLVISADVIEHVADPDALMRFICGIARDRVVLSTPDRDLVYRRLERSRFGPPANPSHLREWTRPEFAEYVGRYLDIERHEISNAEQMTQMIVGRPRR